MIDGHNKLSHSREATFKTCARKHYLGYELGIRPNHNADPLRIGHAFHAGLESIKNGTPEADAIAEVRKAYQCTTCPPWLTYDEYRVEEETTIAMVLGWARRWAGDLIVKYVAVELSFDLPIINPSTGRESRTFRSVGKIDGIAELPNGKLAIVEHKSASESVEPGSDYWGKLLMDSQISRYILAARGVGYDVQSVVYDVTRKPGIKPKDISKANVALATSDQHYFGLAIDGRCPPRETPMMFGARVLDDMKQFPEWYFGRMEITRLDDDLAEFAAEQWTLAEQIRHAQLNTEKWGMAAWPRNTNACTGFGRCQYFDVCRGVLGNPTESIPSGFKQTKTLHVELTPADAGKEQK